MHNRGNALFLILIAVALFAALSYAVTNSGRGGGGTDAEETVLQASALYNMAGSVQTAVNRLKIINECTARDIALNSGPAFDTDPRPDPDCDVFGQNGGGVSFNWDGTTGAGLDYQDANSANRDYYPVKVGNGASIPVTVYWFQSGGNEFLWLDFIASRGGPVVGVSSSEFDSFWSVAEDVNERGGFPDPVTVSNNYLAEYNFAPALGSGDNTNNSSSDTIEVFFTLDSN